MFELCPSCAAKMTRSIANPDRHRINPLAMETILRNQWYLACLSSELKDKSLLHRVIAQEPMVLFRDAKGNPTALRDICPHRGIPLSYGRWVQGEVECPYHGWTFDREGVCSKIPSLTSEQTLDCRKIKVKRYQTQEFQGMIWIFLLPAKSVSPENQILDQALAPVPPRIPFLPDNARPALVEFADFPCSIDHAVIGLMDPAHGPYVHKSWFWRSTKTTYEKKKHFGPIPFGFRMLRHQPSSNSKAYKILGGKPTTEISFQLPATRTEHVNVGRRNFYSYTALTPVGENLTRVTQMLYWDSWFFTFLKPFIRQFTKVFLNQDMDAVTRQQDGLKWDPTLMLINDADTQAKWYFRLKEEWLRFEKEPTEFKHPVKESVLQWRS